MRTDCKEYVGDSDTSIFSAAIGKDCVVNEKYKAEIVGVLFIDGALHYHCLFTGVHETKSGRKKPYKWSGIQEHHYVNIQHEN